MPSQAYYDWKKAGEPYTRAQPTKDFKTLLQGYGYTVYDYPNEDHQQAVPPQDHTPYSATGYPIASKRWVGHADDVMPPNAAALAKGAVPLPALARQIIADKDAGVPGTKWIKYINWTDEAGSCWHTSWQPDKKTTTSTDKGHIHISGRSDMDTSTEVSSSGWDPVRRAASMTTPGQNDVIVGDSILWDKAANRSDPTGRNFANDVYVVVSKALEDEFGEVGRALAAGFAQMAGIMSQMQSKIDELETKIAASGATVTVTGPLTITGTLSGSVSGTITGTAASETK